MNDLTRYKLMKEAPLPPAAKLLYSYLVDRVGGGKRTICLSNTQMAVDLGISPSTVRRNMNRLHRLGWVQRKARYSEEGIRLANQLTLN